MTRPTLFAVNATPSRPKLEAVKICGLVSADDARMVVQFANRILPPHTELLLGMILWPKSKRSVSIPTAKEISSIARGSGATPVAVFVDEDVSTMEDVCQKCGVGVAQLHGSKSRNSWANHSTNTNLKWIDVQHVDPNGEVQSINLDVSDRPLWTLFDTKGGGTGKAFDWNNFSPPSHSWLLAGGLHPENVTNAVRMLSPAGLDVASGVTGPDRCAKDEKKVKMFLEKAVKAYSM